MKVIFVGVHNKPGLPPLCSTTKTGKLIDRVIVKLPITIERIKYVGKIESKEIEYVKSNLFDTDYLPEDLEAANEYMMWFDRINPEEGDIVIVLGKKIRGWFEISEYGFKIIYVRHPAGVYSNMKMDSYVGSLVNKINQLIP